MYSQMVSMVHIQFIQPDLTPQSLVWSLDRYSVVLGSICKLRHCVVLVKAYNHVTRHFFSMSESAPPPSSILFARGVIARLSIWPILRLAVQDGWGGPSSAQKQTWLASTILDSFETEIPVPDDQYVEEMLLQVMADEFDTQVEDGSSEDVAGDIVRIWDEAKVGKSDLVVKFEALADKLKGVKAVAHQVPVSAEDEWEEEEDDEESSEEEGDAPAPRVKEKEEPVVDEDGFTLVQGKGKGRRWWVMFFSICLFLN